MDGSKQDLCFAPKSCQNGKTRVLREAHQIEAKLRLTFEGIGE
jgi:hypothetical protein